MQCKYNLTIINVLNMIDVVVVNKIYVLNLTMIRSLYLKQVTLIESRKYNLPSMDCLVLK